MPSLVPRMPRWCHYDRESGGLPVPPKQHTFATFEEWAHRYRWNTKVTETNSLMSKNTAIMYIVVFLAGVLGGVLVPKSFYSPLTPTVSAHVTPQMSPIADRP